MVLFSDITSATTARTDSTAMMMSRTQEPAHSLKGHRRNITDLDWSPTDPNLIATSSIDTFAHIWDYQRDNRRPIISFSSVGKQISLIDR